MRNFSKQLSLPAAIFTGALAFGLGTSGVRAADDEKDISAARARTLIEDLEVGDELGTDGTVRDNKDEIKAGRTIYASFKTDKLDPNSAVKAVWRGPDGARYESAVQHLGKGAHKLVFVAPDTSSWKPGEYHVDIRIADELGGTEDFKIEEAVVE